MKTKTIYLNSKYTIKLGTYLLNQLQKNLFKMKYYIMYHTYDIVFADLKGTDKSIYIKNRRFV